MATGNEVKMTGGIGFTGLLTVAFIVLKLCGVINWSWFWVVSPLWIGFLTIIAVIVMLLLILWIYAVFNN